MNETYADRIYELLRLIYLSIINTSTATAHTVGSTVLTGVGSTASGVYRAVRFYNPDTNGASVLVNNVPLVPGASRTYSVDRPDTLEAISYDAGTQIIYVEYIV